MAYHSFPGIQFMPGSVKGSIPDRIAAGAKVKTTAPTSPLYALADIKAAVDTVGTETDTLKTLLEQYDQARAGLAKARTALGDGVFEWDRSYRVLASAGEKHAANTDDGTSLGLTVRGTTHNPLAMPLEVTAVYAARKDLIRVHVYRAPGMKVVLAQVSPDPVTATSWKDLPGYGAIHTIAGPATGTWWVRAASKTAKGMSDFTTPIAVIVK